MACKKAKGKRGKTRRKLKRKGSRLTIAGYLNKPAEKSKVMIDIDSSVHDGMPSARCQGMIGIVQSVKKNSVKVLVGKAGKKKMIIVHPAHLCIVGGESK